MYLVASEVAPLGGRQPTRALPRLPQLRLLAQAPQPRCSQRQTSQHLPTRPQTWPVPGQPNQTSRPSATQRGPAAGSARSPAHGAPHVPATHVMGMCCVTPQTPPRFPVPKEPLPGRDQARAARRRPPRTGTAGLLTRLHARAASRTDGRQHSEAPFQDTCPWSTGKQNQVLV